MVRWEPGAMLAMVDMCMDMLNAYKQRLLCLLYACLLLPLWPSVIGEPFGHAVHGCGGVSTRAICC
jgi:hypothetical protein